MKSEKEKEQTTLKINGLESYPEQMLSYRC